MSDRFFIAEPITSDRVTLDGPEAHHLLHVMRAAAGTEIVLFDNSGAEFTAVVEDTRRGEAVVKIVERHELNRELPCPLVVGVALPKGDRQKWLVEKLTELGVTALVPLVTDRGVAQPTASAAERLTRAVIEAAKQCGRNRLMQICEPMKWQNWIESNFGFRISDCGLNNESAIGNPQSAIDGLPNSTAGCLGSSRPSPGAGALEPPEPWRRLLAHPAGRPLAEAAGLYTTPSPTVLAIGPEGGFTDTEVAAARAAGWQQVALGPRILRVETAAIALASACALRCL
ncbi:MAG: RsmE family RNA methyltransferase [Pirellulales bacterium]